MARKPKWRVSARVESYKTVTVSAETLDEALALATDRLCLPSEIRAAPLHSLQNAATGAQA